MEYMATYGWALFAIFVVVAFLVGSGILSPARFSGEECSFIPGLPCGSYYLTRGSTAQQPTLGFNLTNNLGYPIYIKDCVFKIVNGPSVEESNQPLVCAGMGHIGFIRAGEVATYQIGFPGARVLSANDYKRIYVTLTFRNCQDLSEADCAPNGNLVSYPWHNLSGRMQLYVRNT